MPFIEVTLLAEVQSLALTRRVRPRIVTGIMERAFLDFLRVLSWRSFVSHNLTWVVQGLALGHIAETENSLIARFIESLIHVLALLSVRVRLVHSSAVTTESYIQYVIEILKIFIVFPHFPEDFCYGTIIFGIVGNPGRSAPRNFFGARLVLDNIFSGVIYR